MRTEALNYDDPKSSVRCLRITYAENHGVEVYKDMPPPVQQTYKGLLKAFVNRTTLHGIGRIISSHSRARRNAWVIVCLTLISWAAAQCYRVVIEYNERPFQMSRITKEENKVEFPAVTICNLNPLPNKDNLKDHETWGLFLALENEVDPPKGESSAATQNKIPNAVPSFGQNLLVSEGDLYDDMTGGDTDARIERSIPDTDEGEKLIEEEGLPKRDWLNLGKDEVDGNNFSEQGSGPECNIPMEVNCTKDHFQCDDGSCIPLRWRCNGILDCPAKSDEINCTSCAEGYFQCPNSSKCVEGYRVCDVQENCLQGSNEQSTCDKCPPDYFRCRSGRCLHPTFFCDGISDCDLEEDEIKCVINDTKAHRNRLLCSKHYRTVLELNEVEFSSVNLAMITKRCPMDDFEESTHWSPMCSIEVLCDDFGCYDVKLKKYIEFQSSTSAIRCSYCSQDFNCWKDDWIKEWANNSLNYESLKMLLKKKEPDFHDITTLYTPTRDVLEKASVSTEKFIYSCNFYGKVCRPKDFFTWIDNTYGKCYTFNSKNIFEVEEAGSTHGLRLNLNVKTGLALLSPEVGLRVMIHDPREMPFPQENGFNVGSDSVSVSVSKMAIEHYGEESGLCKRSQGKFPAYSLLLCKKLCIEREYRRQCSCIVDQHLAFEQLHDTGINLTSCSNLNIENRLCKAKVQLLHKKGKLGCHCLQNCREEFYKPQVTTSKLNELYFRNLNEHRQKVDYIQDNRNNILVSLHVYLESLSYELIEENPSFTWEGLVGTLGGTLGLVVGVSIVTIIEAVELLLDIWSLFWSHFLARRGKVHA